MAGKRKRAVLAFVLILVTLVMIFPLLWVVILSFKTSAQIFSEPFNLPNHFDFANYRKVFNVMNLSILYKNTAIIAFFSVMLGIIITFMSSFALSRMVFKHKRMKNQLYNYFLLGLTIPPMILLFPVYRLTVTLHLFGTYLSLILPYTAMNIAFNTLLFVGFLNDFPGEVEEAAIIDGCGLRKLCTKVVVPMSKPIISTILIFNVLYIWNEYPFASVLISNTEKYTIPMGSAFFKGMFSMDYGGLIASSVLIMVPQLIFYGIFQRYIVDGMAAGAVKG